MRVSSQRLISLIFLSALLGVTSLFAWLWLVVFPVSLFLVDPLAALCRSPVFVIAFESPRVVRRACGGWHLVVSGMGVSSGAHLSGVCSGTRSFLDGAVLFLGSL